MDIICAKCDRHFSSIEAAREHSGHCKETSKGESIRWIPAPKSKITPEEWERLMQLINPQYALPPKTPSDVEPTAVESENSKDSSEPAAVRLKRLRKEVHPDYVSVCPKCGRKSLWHNVKEDKYECLNLKCMAVMSSPDETAERIERPSVSKNRDSAGSNRNKRNGMDSFGRLLKMKELRLLLIPVILLLGCAFTRSYIPLWLLLGVSVIYPTEKWFSHITKRSKTIGKSYRLLLNLGILVTLGLLIQSSIKLFSGGFHYEPIVGASMFIAELIFFIWMWKVVARNSWRRPSMKFTVFSLLCLSVVFAFAGVQPLASYKDNLIGKVKPLIATIIEGTEDIIEDASTVIEDTEDIIEDASTVIEDITTEDTESSFGTKSGVYRNYYLGLVKDSKGVYAGSECYGKFLVLINNEEARNPTYQELLNFLKADKTDEFPYRLSLFPGFYSGSPEDLIDLDIIRGIVEGIRQPEPPRICADFAERLHNNAEAAGIRCGYVNLELIGYTDPSNLGIPSSTGHACNIFDTVDRGVVFIDCTGILGSYGPSSCDKIVDVVVGSKYVPVSIFPEPGWSSTWEETGTVTSISITWDGEWR